MQNGVCVRAGRIQKFDRLSCRQDAQLDIATPGFVFERIHDRQGPSSCTYYQTAAIPGYPLFYRERCMAKLVTEFLGRLFLSFQDFSTVNNHIMMVRHAIDADGPETKLFKLHFPPNATLVSLPQVQRRSRRRRPDALSTRTGRLISAACARDALQKEVESCAGSTLTDGLPSTAV